jgi:hypothetical protein
MNQSKAAQEPSLGYKLSMRLSNQLGFSKASLVKALNGQGKRVAATTIMNTLQGSFIFRKLGNSTCIDVVSKAGQLVCANIPDAVPTKDNIVKNKSMHARQLLHTIC